MTTPNTAARRTTETLRAAVSGGVFVPGEAGYDEARQAWNLATDERPAVVVVAGSAADVVQAVRFARSRGMRIAPQGTGHGSEPLEPLQGAMLLRTVQMRGRVGRRRGAGGPVRPVPGDADRPAGHRSRF